MKLNFSDILSLFVPHYICSAFITSFFIFFLSSGEIITSTFSFSIILYSICIIAFNSYNMVFDIDIDKLNKPLRPIPSQKISRKIVLYLSIFLFLLAIFSALLINWQLALLFSAFFVEAIFYSTPPLRLRRFLLFSNFNAAFIFGLIPLLMVKLVTNLSLPLEFSLYILALIFIVATVKDYEDIRGEKLIGIKTIPNFFGVSFSNKLVFGGYFFLHFLMVLLFILKSNLIFLTVSLLGLVFSLLIYLQLRKFKFSISTKIHSPLVNFTLFFTYLIQSIFILASWGVS